MRKPRIAGLIMVTGSSAYQKGWLALPSTSPTYLAHVTAEQHSSRGLGQSLCLSSSNQTAGMPRVNIMAQPMLLAQLRLTGGVGEFLQKTNLMGAGTFGCQVLTMGPCHRHYYVAETHLHNYSKHLLNETFQIMLKISTQKRSFKFRNTH